MGANEALGPKKTEKGQKNRVYPQDYPERGIDISLKMTYSWATQLNEKQLNEKRCQPVSQSFLVFGG